MYRIFISIQLVYIAQQILKLNMILFFHYFLEHEEGVKTEAMNFAPNRTHFFQIKKRSRLNIKYTIYENMFFCAKVFCENLWSSV